MELEDSVHIATVLLNQHIPNREGGLVHSGKEQVMVECVLSPRKQENIE